MLLSEELGISQFHDENIAEGVELEDCLIVHDDFARRQGELVKLKLWGSEDEITFQCKHDVSVKSYLLERVSLSRTPKIVHILRINAAQPIEVIIEEHKENSIIGLQIEAVRLTGRLKALSDSFGMYDATPETLELCKALGHALQMRENIGKTDILTNIRFIDDAIIHVSDKCPCCKGEVVYKYRYKNVSICDKECMACGWRGFLDLNNGRGVVTSIPLTTSVRNLLNSLSLADAEDIYERLFEVGMKPAKIIAKATQLAKQDIREAKHASR